ncbi:MAG: hypothetical protein ABR599_02365, partial [Gemmatimonadota bacterium]
MPMDTNREGAGEDAGGAPASGSHAGGAGANADRERWVEGDLESGADPVAGSGEPATGEGPGAAGGG